MACTCVCILVVFLHSRLLRLLQLIHCLQEWHLGSFNQILFSGEEYASVYDGIVKLFDDTMSDPYHGRKLRRLLQTIGTEAR